VARSKPASGPERFVAPLVLLLGGGARQLRRPALNASTGRGAKILMEITCVPLARVA